MILLYLLFVCCVVKCDEPLSAQSLARLSSLNLGCGLSLDPDDSNNHFVHLNKTRVPGSKGSLEVREYIKDHFDELNKEGEVWLIEEDNFVEKGYNFSNIVVQTACADARDKLVVAAHYDTLIKPEGFIGAIDSAVSCGIMLDISRALNGLLRSHLDEMDMGLAFIFFDGEEAFEKWSATDSIYGARHLHSKWMKSAELATIDLFVLLDLLGGELNYVPSYFPQTHENYNDMAILERRLLNDFPEIMKSQNFFANPSDYEREYFGIIEDDHIPFLRSRVPVLHLIPSRFPETWHTINDDFLHVDINSIKRWNYLMAAFIIEYLELPV